MPRIPHRRRPLAVVAAAAAAAVVVAACGGTGGGSGGSGSAAAGPKPLPPSTAGLPPALAENVKQADQIIGEGTGDLETRLKKLRGHPVVVNQWASWCPNCRAEFPFFTALSAKYGDQVAFLGLDSQDERDAAEDFLTEFTSGFPSIFDPDASAAASLGMGQAWPSTVYLDEQGEQVFVKVGGYATLEQLEADIRQHALGQGA